MKVNLSISKRIDAQGHSEVMLLIRRRLDGKVIDIRAKSGVFIEPKMFDAKKNCVKTFAANKLLTEEVKYHNAQLKKLDALLVRINEAYNNEADKDNVCGKWLEDIVHSDKGKELEDKKDIYALFDAYLRCRPRSKSTNMKLRSCIRPIPRYEIFVRETDKRRKGFVFDVDTVTRKDIEGLRDYINHEKELSEEYPQIFDKIYSKTQNVKRKTNARGCNSSYKIMKNLKSFFIWMNQDGITENKPFDGVDIGFERYGTPYYITAEERDKIASTPMPSRKLEEQRDIFVFQCLIGCRVYDLTRFTKDNITDRMLIYTPHKTKNESQQALQARVPLHEKAVGLIEKYKGVDKKGRLFPFTDDNSYNVYIRKIFTISGITRMVEIRNSLTGEIENRPINEVASSHLARRTFVGNLYSKVPDPNLIGKMSGHVDGSKAFARYRKIEDETLRSVIDLL